MLFFSFFVSDFSSWLSCWRSEIKLCSLIRLLTRNKIEDIQIIFWNEKLTFSKYFQNHCKTGNHPLKYISRLIKSKATLQSKNNTRIASSIKVFVAFLEQFTINKVWNCFFSALLRLLFFSRKEGSTSLLLPLPALYRYLVNFFISYTKLGNNTAYCVSKDDITQFHVLLFIYLFFIYFI